jgi:hypothetical protein
LSAKRRILVEEVKASRLGEPDREIWMFDAEVGKAISLLPNPRQPPLVHDVRQHPLSDHFIRHRGLRRTISNAKCIEADGCLNDLRSSPDLCDTNEFGQLGRQIIQQNVFEKPASTRCAGSGDGCDERFGVLDTVQQALHSYATELSVRL